MPCTICLLKGEKPRSAVGVFNRTDVGKKGAKYESDDSPMYAHMCGHHAKYFAK